MTFDEIIEAIPVWDFLRIGIAGFVCLISYFILYYIVSAFVSVLEKRIPKPMAEVVHFFLLYSLYAVVVGVTLNVAGFNIAALLGAAGVFGVAIGFASQTTVSNVISGIFLMIEQSLRVGDVIQLDSIQGRILHVGLLSVELKTIDNRIIRVPNEHLIKSNVTNITALKERVIAFNASSATEKEAKKVLRDAWSRMDFAIKEKEVSITYSASSSSLVGFSVNIWVKTHNIVPAKSEYIEKCVEVAKEQNVALYVSVQK